MTSGVSWRLAAVIAVLLLVGLAAWGEPVHDLTAHVANGRMSDFDLYQAVAQQVGRGADYYAAAVQMQRSNGFPLHPFVTVRLPTLAWLLGHLGYGGALTLATALIVANAVIWFGALAFTRPAERVCIVALVLLGSIIVPQVVYIHEWWAGQLLSGALGLFLHKRRLTGLVLAIVALLVREHSVLFVLACLPFLHDRQRQIPLLLGLIALATFGLVLMLHRAQVAALVLPTDLTSPGWWELRGPAGPSTDVQDMLLFGRPAKPLGSLLAFAPVLGWAEVATRRSTLPLIWFGGFLTVLATVARDDNAFWVLMILPSYVAGIALAPRALVSLVREVWARAAPGGGTAGSPAVKG